MNNYIKELKQARLDLGLTLEDVSKDIGIGRSYLGSIENCKNELSPKFGIALCEYYGIETEMYVRYAYEWKKLKSLQELETSCKAQNIAFPEELQAELDALRRHM